MRNDSHCSVHLGLIRGSDAQMRGISSHVEKVRHLYIVVSGAEVIIKKMRLTCGAKVLSVAQDKVDTTTPNS